MFALPAELSRLGLSARDASEQDGPFLRALYATARPDAALLAQWPAPAREAFLDSQFRFQSLGYREAYPRADFLVLEQHGELVGRVILDRGPQEWCLVDIAFVPAVREQGLGTIMLRAVQTAAAEAGAAEVNLHVEIGNRARAFYERLGFVETDSESGAHIAMRWLVPS